ncbi:MAG: anti-sigma factor [Acidobacteria bacterium]|nr:anti-sigma factor [Acidobacteriota bacterium]
MTEEQRDLLFDLLTKKVLYGLEPSEEQQLAEFDQSVVEAEFRSLEITTAAINMAELGDFEPMPDHLFARVSESASEWMPNAAAEEAETAPAWQPAEDRGITYAEPERPSLGWFGWLGWAAAAAASIALALNLFVYRPATPEVAKQEPPAQPQPITPADLRAQLLTAPNAVKAEWSAGNVKEIAQITGDVVWSDDKQTGYMRFRGLPVNDANKEQYQLWIFEDAKLEAHPKDGGVFDVTADGEVIVPINAKLLTKSPKVFAITIEPPGGVVVSKREKIAALAKVAA